MVMSKKREVTFCKFPSFEAAHSEDACMHQESENFWDATMRLLDMWFVMHGLDAEAQRIDRSVFIKREAPWVSGEADVFGKDFDT